MGKLLQLSSLVYRECHAAPGCLGTFVHETMHDVNFNYEGLGTETLKEAQVIRCSGCGVTFFCEVFQRELERRKARDILQRSLPKITPAELKYIRLLIGYNHGDMARLLQTSDKDYQVREMLMGGDERIRRILIRNLLPS